MRITYVSSPLVNDKYLISSHEPLKNWISYMAGAGIRGPNGLDL